MPLDTAGSSKKTKLSQTIKKQKNMETIQIKSLSGSVIFEQTAENNTITLTVEAAVSCGVSLAKANLVGACLAVADLTGADLTGADLTGADISWADLADANLKEANLKDSNPNRTYPEDANHEGTEP